VSPFSIKTLSNNGVGKAALFTKKDGNPDETQNSICAGEKTNSEQWQFTESASHDHSAQHGHFAWHHNFAWRYNPAH
jgi:hypothetical protein